MFPVYPLLGSQRLIPLELFNSSACTLLDYTSKCFVKKEENNATRAERERMRRENNQQLNLELQKDLLRTSAVSKIEIDRPDSSQPEALFSDLLNVFLR